MLNGIFWILCSGAKWRDLPERYCPWKTIYDRFCHWRDDGTFEAVLARLQLRLREDGLMDLDTWMIDSTSIRATRAASGGGKSPGAPRGFDKPRYRDRNFIERCFGWVKELRRICTRCDKLASIFRAMVCLVCINRCLQADFSDKS